MRIGIGMKLDTKHNRGFTLIEVLVSVLILGVGLLGLASLQANSLRNNHSVYLRTQASLLAYDLIDRIRANKNTAIISNTYLIDFDEAPENVTNCQNTGANCTGTDMALFDINQWKCTLGAWDANGFCTALGIKGSLPGGLASVTRDADNTFTIQIRYNERAGQLNADMTTLQMRARL